MRVLQKGYVRVSKIHKLYYELRGKKNGIPAVSLHGGPGSQFKPKHVKSFPENNCVLFFDQRGCGRSKPLGELRENTTQHLVEDIAVLMDYVGFKKAKIVGASWGSTLALCFAIKHPDRVSKLVIGGVYLGTKEETVQMVRHFALFSPKLLEECRTTPSYFGKINMPMARQLGLLEQSIMDNEKIWKDAKLGKPNKADILELYYISHDCFLPPQYIMRNVHKIAHIPLVVIQGQQDLLCPPITAWTLSKKFKKRKFIIVPGGHSIPNGRIIYKKHM